MELPECLSVRDGNKSDSLVLHVLIQVALNINTQSRGALVQDSVDRFVIDKSSHCNSLFFTPWEHVVPVVLRVPAPLSWHQVLKLDLVENNLKFLFVDSLAFHLFDRMRIDDLVSQSPLRQIRSLRDVENLIDCGLVDTATKNRPEFSKNTEKWRFSTSVGSCNEKMHAWCYTEIHWLDQNVTVRRKNWHVFKNHIIWQDDLTFISFKLALNIGSFLAIHL